MTETQNQIGERASSTGSRARETKLATRLYPPQEVATRWHWHTESVRRAIREGRIASIVISRRRLVPESELEKIESEGRIDARLDVGRLS
jgi:hypothetical protein